MNLLVLPEEHTAINGITLFARSVGLVIGVYLSSYLISSDVDSLFFSAPFLLAGCIKIFYDITIGCCFLYNKKKAPAVQEVGSM